MNCQTVTQWLRPSPTRSPSPPPRAINQCHDHRRLGVESALWPPVLRWATARATAGWRAGQAQTWALGGKPADPAAAAASENKPNRCGSARELSEPMRAPPRRWPSRAPPWHRILPGCRRARAARARARANRHADAQTRTRTSTSAHGKSHAPRADRDGRARTPAAREYRDADTRRRGHAVRARARRHAEARACTLRQESACPLPLGRLARPTAADGTGGPRTTTPSVHTPLNSQKARERERACVARKPARALSLSLSLPRRRGVYAWRNGGRWPRWMGCAYSMQVKDATCADHKSRMLIIFQLG